MKKCIYLILIIPVFLNGQINLSVFQTSRTFTHKDHVKNETWSSFTTTLYSDENSPYNDSRIKMDFHFIRIKGMEDKWIIRCSAKTHLQEHLLDKEAYLILDRKPSKLIISKVTEPNKLDDYETSELGGRTYISEQENSKFLTQYLIEFPETFDGWSDQKEGFIQLYFGGLPYSFELPRNIIKKVNDL